MVFPLLRVDGNICVLPVLAKHSDGASSTAVLNSVLQCEEQNRLCGWITGEVFGDWEGG